MIAPAVVALALLAAEPRGVRALIRAGCAQPPAGYDGFTREEKDVLRERCLEAGGGAPWLDRLRNRHAPVEVGVGGTAMVREGGFFTGGTLRIGVLLEGVRIGVDASLLGGNGFLGLANGAIGVPLGVGEWQLRPSALVGVSYLFGGFPRYLRHFDTTAGMRLELLTPGRVGAICLEGGIARTIGGDVPIYWTTTGWIGTSLVWHFL